ncbi:MAG: cytochrome c peroxidase [Pseudomonadota bacterium]
MLHAVAANAAVQTPNDARALGLESLRTIVQKEGVPLPPNIGIFINDIAAARQLGKALFHEMAVGSDGIQACATCHFAAGADPRTKNQLNPDLLRVKNQRNGNVEGFFNAAADADARFEVDGPNSTLQRDDFPFVRDIGNGANVLISAGTVTPASGNSNDIASSQGVFFTLFNGVDAGALEDRGTPIADSVFNVGGVTTRRVEPRNTPTTINAVFNFTNFWDGRANNFFNGQNPFGRQDRRARIFVNSGLTIIELKLNMRNASLASQAVGPPLSHFEMSFGNGAENFRSFVDIGRKLIPRRALATQAVHPQDSVLGTLRDPSGQGLAVTYEDLIKKAFKPQYWSSTKRIEARNRLRNALRPSDPILFGPELGPVRIIDPETVVAPLDTFNLMEANFSFFWGVAVMLYEATLVADQTPFDQWMAGDGTPVDGFGPAEVRGLDVFAGKGKCINCHGGPEFTNASVRNAQGGQNVIEPMLMGDRTPALYDNGFYNIGVTPTVDDVGRGAKDPFGAPLAFSRQFAFKALGIQNIPFPIIGAPIPPPEEPIQVCTDVNGDGRCGVGEPLLLKRVTVDGAFKTPGLRNVELTAPFFHNGGVATLREVVQFYDRGGNFCQFNRHDFDPDIQVIGLTAQEQEDLVKFLIALTDPRVKIRAAPFDAPEIGIPNGHSGDNSAVTNRGNGQASDDLLTIPAVGANGGAVMTTFLGGVDHLSANPVTGLCSPDFSQP